MHSRIENKFYFRALTHFFARSLFFVYFADRYRLTNTKHAKNLSSETKGQYYLHSPSCIAKSFQAFQFCKLYSTLRIKKAYQEQKAKEKELKNWCSLVTFMVTIKQIFTRKLK